MEGLKLLSALYLADARANFKSKHTTVEHSAIMENGNASLRFIRMKPLIDFDVDWIEKNRE